MFRYAIVEISGRQYKIQPNQDILVDHLGDTKEIKCSKVLMVADGDNLKMGDPYLKGEELTFEVLENYKEPKIRVATYKAKANYRRVIGSRRVVSKIRLKDGSVKKG